MRSLTEIDSILGTLAENDDPVILKASRLVTEREIRKLKKQVLSLFGA